MRKFLLVISIFALSQSWAQDTSFQVANQSFTLADAIVRNNFETVIFGIIGLSFHRNK
jgi:hypothetical protein